MGINKDKFFFLRYRGFKSGFALFIAFTPMFQALAKGVLNKVVRVECDVTHKDDPLKMQFGRVTFYFENEPLVNYMPQREEKSSMVFFFPQATITKEMHAAFLQAFNKEGGFFSLHCEKIKKPIEGIRFAIDYDAHKVVIDKNSFRSSNLEPGVAFSFYNKALLNRLKNQTKGVLNISYQEIRRDCDCLKV